MKNILLIEEDQPIGSPIFKELSDTYGLKVNWITDPGEVITSLNLTKYDGIILDIMLPIPQDWTTEEKSMADIGLATGNILFKKIRTLFPKIPIVIYSAKALSVDIDPYTYYYRKPVLIKDLYKKLLTLNKS